MKRCFCIAAGLAILFSNAQAVNTAIFESTYLPEDVLAKAVPGAYHISVMNDQLFITSGNGIYKYSDQTNDWSIWALEGRNVIDFKANGNKIIAAIAAGSAAEAWPEENARLFAVDLASGEEHSVMIPEMTSNDEEGNPTYFQGFAQNPDDPDQIICAINSRLWKSDDLGEHWSFLAFANLYGPRTFSVWHPYNSEYVYHAGTTMFFYPQVMVSDTKGQEWSEALPYSHGDNSCTGIAFDPSDHAHLICIGDGYIAESNDYGLNWNEVYYNAEQDNPESLTFGVSVHFDPADPDMVYAMGYNPESGDKATLNILKSSNKGASWETFAYVTGIEEGNLYAYDAVWYEDSIYLYTTYGVSYIDARNYTGINIFNPIREKEEQFYDLMGRPVAKPQPGSIYIRNGKKIIFSGKE